MAITCKCFWQDTFPKSILFEFKVSKLNQFSCRGISASILVWRLVSVRHIPEMLELKHMQLKLSATLTQDFFAFKKPKPIYLKRTYRYAYAVCLHFIIQFVTFSD